ncbi:unnamed protein product, partial [Iphiclides podalirius]
MRKECGQLAAVPRRKQPMQRPKEITADNYSPLTSFCKHVNNYLRPPLTRVFSKNSDKETSRKLFPPVEMHNATGAPINPMQMLPSRAGFSIKTRQRLARLRQLKGGAARAVRCNAFREERGGRGGVHGALSISRRAD